MVPLALGSETGGSIRQPAALCGVLGLKPTYGRVSRYGLIAFGSSLDQIGPFAAIDARHGGALRRHRRTRPARLDERGRRRCPTTLRGLTGDVGGLRVGVPRGLLDEGVEPGVKDGVRRGARARWPAAGAILSDITLPHASLAIPVYYLVANAEASSNLARYDGVRYGTRADAETLTEMYYRTRARFGAEVKRRIMIGTFVLSAGYYDAYYVKAQQVRALIRKDYDEAFTQVDVVALPTSPTVAFRLGARTADPIQMYLADVFTAAANLAGLPAISIPVRTDEGKAAGGSSVDGAAVRRSDASARRRRPGTPHRHATAGRRFSLTSSQTITPSATNGSSGTASTRPATRRRRARRAKRIGPTTSITTPMTINFTRRSGRRISRRTTLTTTATTMRVNEDRDRR